MQTIEQKAGVTFPGISTVFFCHDGQGNLFFSQRSQRTRDERGTWEPGGGRLELGLTAEENVRKELAEEYGGTAQRIDFIGYLDVRRTNHEGQATHWLALCFAVLVEHDQLKISEPEYIQDAGWFTLNALPSPLHSQMEPFLQKYGERLKELISA